MNVEIVFSLSPEVLTRIDICLVILALWLIPTVMFKIISLYNQATTEPNKIADLDFGALAGLIQGLFLSALMAEQKKMSRRGYKTLNDWKADLLIRATLVVTDYIGNVAIEEIRNKYGYGSVGDDDFITRHCRMLFGQFDRAGIIGKIYDQKITTDRELAIEVTR